MTVSVDPLVVGNLASLREYTVGSLTSTGSTYNIKIRAHNNAGYTDSAPLVVVLAAVPDTPTVAPTSDATMTNKTLIKIDYTPLTSAQNGGSDVLSYDLQMDDGEGGNFTSLIGGEGAADSLATTYTNGYNLISGNLYRFKYRARNVNGWSASFSPIAYIRAATRPQRPAAPVFLSVDATSITVQITKTLDDGGSNVLSY